MIKNTGDIIAIFANWRTGGSISINDNVFSFIWSDRNLLYRLDICLHHKLPIQITRPGLESMLPDFHRDIKGNEHYVAGKIERHFTQFHGKDLEVEVSPGVGTNANTCRMDVWLT